MAELIVVTGPPGAGKSTVARLLSAGFERSALVEGDRFFAFLDRGAVPPWEPAANEQNDVVIRAAAAAAGRFADGGYAVVYDGIVGPWFLATFADWTGRADLHYAVLLPSEERCVERVRSRVGHAFTDLDATRHMHRQFARAEMEPRHVVTGDDDAGTVAASIRERLAAGSLRHPPR